MISRECGEVRRGAALPVGLSLLILALSLLPSIASNPVGAAATARATSLVSSTHKPARTCSVDDVVYLPGDAVPGREACERCECGAGGRLLCRRRACPVRPGCKALHRPDECCPQYQCDCELEGRVYANGEKLVDPVDPCKVCYCQGGEVVCRRIACFLRNDCEPRLVPGRCCPEYDHCPLRGVTTEAGKGAGVTTSVGSAAVNKLETVSQKSEENIKKEITIKEVTPVSEIPAIASGIRIKEIPPMSVAEVNSHISVPVPTSTGLASPETISSYGSSPTTESTLTKTENSADKVQIVRTEDQSSAPFTVSTTLGLPSELTVTPAGSQSVETNPPRRPQKEVAPQATVTIPKNVSSPSPTTTAQPAPQPIPEEEDPGFELVNPAFPPLPDDLSQLNRDDSDATEIHEHPSPTPAHTAIRSTPESTVAPRANVGTQLATASTETERIPEEWLRENQSTDRPLKTSPLLNLRSALPTEILNVPSALPEVITGELDLVEENATVVEDSIQQFEFSTAKDLPPGASTPSPVNTSPTVRLDTTPSSSSVYVETHRGSEVPNLLFERESSTTSSPARAIEERRPEIAAVATETVVLESAPAVTTTVVAESIGFELKSPTEKPEPAILESSVTASATPVLITNPPQVVQIVHETTTPKNIEFSKATEATEASVVVTFPGAEVEVLRETDEEESRNGAIVRASNSHNNVLTDLINLVGDVASIGDRTERPRPTAGSGAFERSETHRVKNSNGVVSETATERLASDATVEISNDDEDTEAVTDSPPPLDRVEPTTRRPLIDRVSDAQPPSRVAGSTDETDIEIIGQSYVPTVGRRPTKVVMRKKSERVDSTATSSSAPAVTVDTPVPASSSAYSSTSASESPSSPPTQ